MPDMMSIVVVSSNRAKIADVRALLGFLPIEVLTAAEALGETLPNVVEDGESFEDNARKKAKAIAEVAMMLTVADDAGLEVQVLGGRPGVRSLRFAGEGATDAENNAELLRRMEEIPDGQRQARMVAVIALVDPWDKTAEVVVEGVCDGKIARSASGTGGFGYDALFVPDGDDRTLAELSEEERSEVSHRAKAMRALQPKLATMLKKRLKDADAILRGAYAPPPSSRRLS
jgi:XTP/dITP diphosphohydrolase